MKPICFVLWLLCAAAGCLPAATPGAAGPSAVPRIVPPSYWAPLVFKPGAATERSYRADEIKWFEKHLIPAISKPWEGEPWKEQALAFVRERLAFFQWRHAWDSRLPVKVSAKVLTDAGCADPWVRLLAAHLSDAAGRRTDMMEAFNMIRDSGLDPALLRFAALPLLMNNGGQAEERDILLDLFTGWTAELGKSPCYAGKDGDLLFRHLRKLPGFRFHPPTLLARLKEANTMPAWIMDTIAGEAEIDLAWDSRGSGWASTVTEEGWKGFHQHLAVARKHLIAAWQAKPDQPHAAAQMIAVVMADGAKRGENERLWFDRATAACFDYESAYSRYRQALQPRWGGSYDTMLAFGLACVDSKRFDTYAPVTYFEVLDQMAEELENCAVVYRHPEVAPRVKALNEALLAAAATPEEKWNRQSFIVLDSWLTGDWETGYTQLEAIKAKTSRVIQSKLNRLGVSLGRMVTDVGLFGSKSGAPARQADAKERAGDRAGAAALWQEWQKGFSGPPEIKAAGEIRLRAALLGKEYAAGKWVQLPVDQPEDWDRMNGKWDGGSIGGLTAIGESADGFNIAVYPLSAGPRFELRAKYKIIGKIKPSDLPHLQLHAGFNPLSNYASGTVVAAVGTKGIYGFLSQNSRITTETTPFLCQPEPTETVELYLRRTGGQLTYVVNGKPIFEKSELDPGKPDWEHGHIGVGARRLGAGLKVTVISLEMRRLP